jgi:predicted permease
VGQKIMVDIVAKIVPIIILIGFGRYLGYNGILCQSTIDEIKKVVMDIALSSVLFLAFINMDLKAEYFFLCLLTFALLCSLYLIGIGINLFKGVTHPLLPFMVTGNAFGFLGIPLFTTVFGSENIGKLSILGVGHEFFVWFVLITLMRMTLKKERFSMSIAKDMIKSPLIVSVILGITLNIMGLGLWIQENPFTKGFYMTLQYLSNLATPLILIIVGYGLKFDRKYMKQSLKFVMIRSFVILTIGYIFKFLLLDRFVLVDQMFDYAFFTFLILPPPLSLSIFIGRFSTKENEELANNTIVLNTVIAVVVFIMFVLTI